LAAIMLPKILIGTVIQQVARKGIKPKYSPKDSNKSPMCRIPKGRNNGPLRSSISTDVMKKNNIEARNRTHKLKQIILNNVCLDLKNDKALNGTTKKVKITTDITMRTCLASESSITAYVMKKGNSVANIEARNRTHKLKRIILNNVCLDLKNDKALNSTTKKVKITADIAMKAILASESSITACIMKNNNIVNIEARNGTHKPKRIILNNVCLELKNDEALNSTTKKVEITAADIAMRKILSSSPKS
jgi:hypothetical protein